MVSTPNWYGQRHVGAPQERPVMEVVSQQRPTPHAQVSGYNAVGVAMGGTSSVCQVVCGRVRRCQGSMHAVNDVLGRGERVVAHTPGVCVSVVSAVCVSTTSV